MILSMPWLWTELIRPSQSVFYWKLFIELSQDVIHEDQNENFEEENIFHRFHRLTSENWSCVATHVRAYRAPRSSTQMQLAYISKSCFNRITRSLMAGSILVWLNWFVYVHQYAIFHARSKLTWISWDETLWSLFFSLKLTSLPEKLIQSLPSRKDFFFNVLVGAAFLRGFPLNDFHSVLYAIRQCFLAFLTSADIHQYTKMNDNRYEKLLNERKINTIKRKKYMWKLCNQNFSTKLIHMFIIRYRCLKSFCIVVKSRLQIIKYRNVQKKFKEMHLSRICWNTYIFFNWARRSKKCSWNLERVTL